ncbi:glycosyltransferase [Swaminathania salitolerans]|uniref:glycosyltransferase n=1 Tax=Swaminathania salitolerans TaxID=182838 RepID=UPI001FE77A05|nr:glycosyltransferase [Swaminathania salitolerans]
MRPQLRTVGGIDRLTGSQDGPIAILLSVYNGEAHLNEQLDSFLAQTDQNWCLYWRDDGSCDASRAIMLSFQEHRGQGRCVEIATCPGNLGVASSYAVLLDAAPETAPVAFADQDDVWVPEKLAWARAALSGIAGPALYHARQYLTDDRLTVRGPSLTLRRDPDFRSALIQNCATGHTVLLNPQAAALIRSRQPPAGILHDWWSYVLVLGAGGRVVSDARCVSFYRQHRRNAVGVERSWLVRGLRALRRGPSAFMSLHAGLAARLGEPDCREILTHDARAFLERLAPVSQCGLWGRMRFLTGEAGFVRQRQAETWLFRLWFVLYGRTRPKS